MLKHPKNKSKDGFLPSLLPVFKTVLHYTKTDFISQKTKQIGIIDDKPEEQRHPYKSGRMKMAVKIRLA